MTATEGRRAANLAIASASVTADLCAHLQKQTAARAARHMNTVLNLGGQFGRSDRGVTLQAYARIVGFAKKTGAGARA